MKKEEKKPDEAISQCEQCKRIKFYSHVKKKPYVKDSLVIFPKLKKIICFACKKENQNSQ